MAENPDAVKVFAPAKINLFLHVGERRADGYHALQSLVVFTEAGDEIRAAPDGDLSFAMNGPFAAALADEKDNLVMRAARTLAGITCVASGARLTLTKNLPIASGIGGGSADAAAALRALWPMWGFADRADRTELLDAAIQTGSDIPVCLLSATAWMEGRGEIVTALDPLPPIAMVLANPRVAVPTGPVFARLAHRSGVTEMNPPSRIVDAPSLVTYLQTARNDLEEPACEIAPSIRDVLAGLGEEGALLARMCGSGATCYGLYADMAAAKQAALALSQKHPGWWVEATKIAPPGIGDPQPMASGNRNAKMV